MLAFYMDHHFRASVTHGLRQRNIDVLTALDDGAEKLADDLLLARALKLDRVVVTHDKDFLRLAADWQANRHDFAGIVFATQGSLHVGNAIDYLEFVAQVMTPDEMRNRVEFLPSGA
jgi:hypothetical protein